MQPELVGWVQEVFVGTGPAPTGATTPILGASPSTHGAGRCTGWLWELTQLPFALLPLLLDRVFS